MACTTMQMIRAYLVAASLLACAVDTCIVVSASVLNLPESFFDTTIFKVSGVLLIAFGVLFINAAASRAYQRAVRYRWVQNDHLWPLVIVGADCAARVLVIHHLRIVRKPFRLAIPR